MFLTISVGFYGLASAETASPAGKHGRKPAQDPGPDTLAEIEKVKAELQKQLEEEATAAKAREEALKKESADALEAARREADKRLEAERRERQEETARLQAALETAAAKEEKREADRAPSVASSLSGLSLYGYLQADFQMRQSSEDQVDPTAGAPLNQDRFLIRRARLGVFLDREYGEGRIELDGNTVNGPAFRLVGAEASVKLPSRTGAKVPIIKGTIGSFRAPFGAETPQDDRARFFLERTTASRAFFPGQYDLGARIAGGWGFIRYVLAVQNGQPLGTAAYPGLDPNHQKDILGRVGVESTVREKVDVAIGLSALRGTGFHSGNLATKSTVQWNDSDENGMLAPGELGASPAIAAGPSSTFTRFGFGADASVSAKLTRLGETTLASEFYLANNLDRGVFPADPKGVVGRNYRELGYYVSLVQRLGRLMIGVRFDYYNPDQDSNKNAKGSPVPTNVSYSTLAAAAAWVASWGRLAVEYDKSWNHLGIGFGGMPSNLKDDALVIRGEVGF